MLLLPVVCAGAQERERLRHRLAAAGESAAARTPAMAVCGFPPAAPARDAHDGLMRQVKPSRVAASLAQRSATTVLSAPVNPHGTSANPVRWCSCRTECHRPDW